MKRKPGTLTEGQENCHDPKKEIKTEGDCVDMDKIVNKRIRCGNVEYLVTRKGTKDIQSTWEPVKNLLDSQDSIEEYEFRTRKTSRLNGWKSMTTDSPRQDVSTDVCSDLDGEGKADDEAGVSNPPKRLVEGVRGRREHNGQVQYLIKWMYFPKVTHNTWESLEDLQRIMKLVDKFEKENKPAAQEDDGILKESDVNWSKEYIQIRNVVSMGPEDGGYIYFQVQRSKSPTEFPENEENLELIPWKILATRRPQDAIQFLLSKVKWN